LMNNVDNVAFAAGSAIAAVEIAAVTLQK
jgi:hypothetical protein